MPGTCLADVLESEIHLFFTLLVCLFVFFQLIYITKTEQILYSMNFMLLAIIITWRVFTIFQNIQFKKTGPITGPREILADKS